METEEQPVTPSPGIDAMRQSDDEEKGSGTIGSSDETAQLGKFATPGALLKAYENLESAFTKKAQALADLKRTQEKNNIQADNAPAPAYMQENWLSEVQSFLRTHKDAQKYAAEISNIILSDKQVASAARPLEAAFGQIAAKKFADPETLKKDPAFLREVLKSVTQGKLPPVVVSRYGGTTAAGSGKKATSLDEAKNYLIDLFK